MKPNRDSVANRLKSIKEEMGISISGMAEQVGSTKTKMNSYLRGVSLPPAEVVNKICELANVTEQWLYYGTKKDFFEDFLKDLDEYDEFLNSHPEIIEKMKRDFIERLSKINNLEEYEKTANYNNIINVYEQVATEVFFVNYYLEFEKYVKDLVYVLALELDEYPSLKDDGTKNSMAFIYHIVDVNKRTIPHIKYGEDEKIEELAREEFDFYKMLILNNAKRNNSIHDDMHVIDFLTSSFSSVEKIYQFIEKLKIENNLIVDFNDDRTKKLIKLISMWHEDLRKIDN